MQRTNRFDCAGNLRGTLLTMLPEPFDKSLILTGPTGSGKTALALDLAKRYDAEIICMDSMTLYRGMDIGTAKPSSAE